MKNTKIEWTDSTINGSSGCDGCELWNANKHTCYAGQVHENRLAHSYPANYAASFDEVRMIPGRLQQAANWGDLTGKERPDKPWLNGRPRHIFVGDMGDFLSAAVTEEFIKREYLGAAESKNGKRHVWQWLTKRPERLAELSEKWGGLPDNVVAMTTVTNQRTADVRIPHLLRVKAKTRGLSCEPLLGPVDLKAVKLPLSASGNIESHPLCHPLIHWVICGGESGHGARPMHPEWARSLRDQCHAAGVAYFFKQWGEWCPGVARLKPYNHAKPEEYVNEVRWVSTGKTVGITERTQQRNLTTPEREPHRFKDGEILTYRIGKEEAGRLLDGREWNEMPGGAP